VQQKAGELWAERLANRFIRPPLGIILREGWWVETIIMIVCVVQEVLD
jgi:hypothetical protein